MSSEFFRLWREEFGSGMRRVLPALVLIELLWIALVMAWSWR